MNEFMFDPKVFIRPPYITCPNCGAEEQFGVLMIGWGYTRRCRECWFTERYDLPEIRKKVIYLDQMAISEMMKALNPASPAYERVDPFWRELFEKLDVLKKLQVIVCPDSATHRAESAVAPDPEALRRMYELLAFGISFNDGPSIRNAQVAEYLPHWLQGEPDHELKLDVEHVTHGGVHKWEEHFFISVGGLDPEGWVDSLRQQRERTAEGIGAVHERWRNSDLSFEELYRTELEAFGRTLLEVYVAEARRREEAIEQGIVDLEILLPSSVSRLVETIHHVLHAEGVPDEELWTKTIEFLQRETLEHIPYVRISCMLYAALARKAQAGQVRPPSRGMVNDVQVVSALLPYCDSMFLDNETAGLLGEEPLRTSLDFGTRIFSWNTRDRFLEYLDQIREAVPGEHVELVETVYGPDWDTPYTTLYARAHGRAEDEEHSPSPKPDDGLGEAPSSGRSTD
jgi:hypothetical protein